MFEMHRHRHKPVVLAAVLSVLVLISGVGHAAPVPDPTRPAIVAGAATTAAAANAPDSALVLQSTMVSPRQRSAIINGRRFRLGERIGDAQIEAIGPGWVQLSTPTGRIELRLSFPLSTRPVNR